MLKRLSSLGNTWALVLDATTRRLLGIETETWLRLTIEDQRLVVEPVEVDDEMNKPRPIRRIRAPVPKLLAKPQVAPEVLEARNVLIALEGIPYQLSKRLIGWEPFIRARLQLYFDDAVPDNMKLRIERAKVCYERRQAGDSWEAAIDAAVAAVPSLEEKRSEPLDPNGSGPGHAVGTGLLELEIKEALAERREVDGDRRPSAA
jgi:hypothetical protein